MPTEREREYYRMGFRDGMKEYQTYGEPMLGIEEMARRGSTGARSPKRTTTPKRKLSAWNKYVKANSKKPRFRYRNGKLNLKKMAVAFRKTRKRGGKR